MDEARFDLRLGPTGRLGVHCTSRVLPEDWSDTLEPDALQQVGVLRDRLARHLITESELVRLGLLLGTGLVPSSVQQSLALHIADARPADPLRIRIVAHDPELASLPWEYLRLPSRFDDLGSAPLVLDERVSVVRSPSNAPPVTAPAHRGPNELRVLHASATDVLGYEPLRGDDHAVDLALWGGQARRTRRVVVDRPADPATRASLGDALRSGADLLVFTGHSTAEGGHPALILADDAGGPDPVGGEELAGMLLRADTQLVILNACDTATSGEASVSLTELLVRSGVETVVGMQMPISDSNAGHFAVGVVGALAEGRSVDAAVAAGRRRVADRAGYAEWGIPTLLTTSSPTPAAVEAAAAAGTAGAVGAVGTAGAVARSAAPVAADTTRGATLTAPTASPGQPESPESPGQPATAGAAPAGSTAHGPLRGGSTPRRSSPLLLGAAALVLIAAVVLLVAGQLRDDPAATTTTTEAPPPSTGPDAPPDGVSGARPLEGTSLTDTSAELRARVEAFERSSASPTVDAAHRRLPTEARSAEWPPLPAAATYASTNQLRNSDCWRVELSSVSLSGVASQVWTDDRHAVLVNAMRLGDATVARQFFWASALHLGLRDGQCAGWPASGLAKDPASLEVSRLDFRVEAPADDLVTAAGTEGGALGGIVDAAYNAAFRTGSTVVVVAAGSTGDERLSEQEASAVIAEVMRAFA